MSHHFSDARFRNWLLMTCECQNLCFPQNNDGLKKNVSKNDLDWHQFCIYAGNVFSFVLYLGIKIAYLFGIDFYIDFGEPCFSTVHNDGAIRFSVRRVEATRAEDDFKMKTSFASSGDPFCFWGVPKSRRGCPKRPIVLRESMLEWFAHHFGKIYRDY